MATLCLACTSQATLVLSVPTPSTALGASAPLDGSAAVIQGPLVSPFVATPASAFSGTLTTTVLKESAAFNPLGGYTFVYNLANAGPNALARLTIDKWLGTPSVVGGNTTAAVSIATDGDRKFAGDIIGFDWSGGIVSGSAGEVFIRTSVSFWQLANGAVLDGGAAGGIATYAVPEPTTVIAGALLLLPFGASTLRILRRNRSTV